MPLAVTEAERTPVCARARLRQIAQGALEKFLDRVIAAEGQHEAVADAGYDLRIACKQAAEEYRRNLRVDSDKEP